MNLGASSGDLVPAAETEQSGAGLRLFVVLLCGFSTAGVYAALVVVILSGNIAALYGILPWLAVAAIGACVVVALSAVVEQSRKRLRRRRRRQATESLAALAARIASLTGAERERSLSDLIKHLELTRGALERMLDTDARSRLAAAGLSRRVEPELDEGHGRWHRVAAAAVLGLLGATDSIPPLSLALDEQDADVAYAAAQALSQFAEPEACEALLDALTAERLPPARIAALIETFRCRDARELIELRAGADDAKVRYWACYLLGRLGDQLSLPVIERLAHDASDDVRANAADAIARFPAQTVLADLLDDESWVVRSHAARSAGIARQPALAPRLAELLEDPAWWVRQNAANALGEIGDAAIPVLVRQLRSSDRFARNKAAEVLVRIGYAGDQVQALGEGGSSGDEPRRFLIDLGRAEALATIATAAKTTSDPALRSRLIGVLDEIGTEAAGVVVRAILAQAGFPAIENISETTDHPELETAART